MGHQAVERLIDEHAHVHGSSPTLNRALASLVATVNQHDTYTGGHSMRVADYAGTIARSMGLGEEQVALTSEAGMVHDIGKIAIPETILKKSKTLTDEEFHLVSLHPILGASILARMPGMEKLVGIVLYHHERWDGEGYPSRLSGVHIPLESRIILVADIYDAMTSKHSLRRTLAPDAAATEIARCAGNQFDPLIVDAFLEAHRNSGLKPFSPTKSLHSLVL